MSLPQTKEDREFVLDRIQKCVALQNEVDTLKEDVKAYVEELSDKYDMSKAEINKLIKVAYNTAKTEEQIEDLQTKVSEWEILQNKSEED